MLFVSSKEIRDNPAILWKNDEVILTVNGKPRAIVIRIDGDPKEMLDTIKKARTQLAVEKLRMFSLEKGLNDLSEEDIEKIIKEVRKEK